jgi:hypothetical protein
LIYKRGWTPASFFFGEYMKKSTIINSCLDAANSLLKSFDNGENPDLNNLSKWSYSLARFVLYHTPQHDMAVEIEHCVQKIYHDKKDYYNILTEYISAVTEAAENINGDEEIVNEPPFTYEWSPLQSQP